RENQEAPGAVIEERTAPDLRPGVARYEFLKIPVEVIGLGNRMIDVPIAQHGPAFLKASFERRWRTRHQEVQQCCRERTRLFQVRQVRTRQGNGLCIRDELCEKVSVPAPRGRGIGLTSDY